jgi:type I restriction enzyme S subunit
MKLTKRPLGEIAELQLGKMLDDKKNRGDPLPYLANVNVRWGEFALDALREMRFQESDKDRFGLRAGDIVMCEGGESGRCAIWNEEIPGMMFQKALHRIRPRAGMDNRFLFFTFLHKGKTGGFDGLLTGSTIKHLPAEKLAKLEIQFPDLPTQRRIADILSAYDDLMENNRRRMALLEESARQLYREWFVRLRYPGHERARRSSALPAGWSRGPLEVHTSFLKRGVAPHYDDEAEGLVINQKCIRDGRVNLELARRQSREFAPARQVQVGDVLINSTGEGTLGRVAQLKSPVENCTVDTHVTIVRPKPGVPVHYFGLCLMDWEPRLCTMGRGSTNQTELSPAAIGACEIVMPAGSVVERFEAHVEPLYTQVTNLVLQNQKLRAARDHLLPRLLSGALPV